MIVEEKTISTKRVFKGKIINLRVDNVRVKNGKNSRREIVEHLGGVVICGITDDGRIPMVRQYRKAAEQVVLEMPAGRLEPGEEPAYAARRELREETGYTASQIREITYGYSSIGYSTEILHLFIATGLVPGETDFDDNEAIEIELYTIDELVDMVYEDRIPDLKSIALILLAQAEMQDQKNADK